MSILEGSSILVTGGTGSFGKAFIARLLKDVKPRRVVIYSRDELKQYEVRHQFKDDPRLRWFLGDIRDLPRLNRAMRGVEYVVHAAAYKQVDTAEYNPYEFVKTNVIGSQNVIEASMDAGVRKVVALSTDKASSPINLYGATKLTADKLFISGNHYAAAYPTRFSVVRYGNVMGSRGSVIPLFRRLAKAGKSLPITSFEMTRFFITLPQAVEFVLGSFELMQGGELYVPRIPSIRIVDLAQATEQAGLLVEERREDVRIVEHVRARGDLALADVDGHLAEHALGAVVEVELVNVQLVGHGGAIVPRFQPIGIIRACLFALSVCHPPAAGFSVGWVYCC